VRLLLFGPPGVGKGTQADLLATKYNLVKFSMGDILREEMSLHSPLGNELEDYVKNGNLVPDGVILELVKDFLLENRDANILFDGFPRNLNQALSLEQNLAQLDMSLDIAIEMHLGEDEIVKRLQNRRQCTDCGRIYNYLTNPPQKIDFCDNCGKKLIKRIDDDGAVIMRRLRVYEEETRPLSDYYRSLSIYKQIDVSGSQEEVFKVISSTINGYINKK